MRAALAFVLVSLLVGSGVRDWRRSHEVRFADLVRELETGERSRESRAAADPGSRDAGAIAKDRAGVSGAPREETAASSSSRRASEPALRPHGIDLNRASAAELERLPGIGPSLAAKIVAERDRNGPFGGADALLRVPGIGPRKLERIRPYLAKPRAPADSGSPIAN
ncbi:MAG TPA: helix-hairpin-helix domain-containing protein [Candidatus Eisenbacteria bacterium]|nr:helix-hairpin-helix domain-containing protein [Candidatus Eisenbacteria bacterium]